MTDELEIPPDEMDALRIVVETMGENAATDDEMAVVEVLAALLMRLERIGAKLH